MDPAGKNGMFLKFSGTYIEEHLKVQSSQMRFLYSKLRQKYKISEIYHESLQFSTYIFNLQKSLFRTPVRKSGLFRTRVRKSKIFNYNLRIENYAKK